MNENKIQRGLGLIITLVFAVIFLITLFAGFIIDYLWFSSLQYAGVFLKILLAKFLNVFLFSVAGFLVLWGNFWVAQALSKKEGTPPGESNFFANFEFGEFTEPLKQLTAGGAKRLPWLLVAVAAVLAVLNGLALYPHWETLLKYFNSAPFGTIDPIFKKDIGFYVFSIPVHKIVRGWLMSMVVLSFLGSSVIYWVSGMFKLYERSISFSKNVKFHLYGLILAGLLMKIWDYRLQMYSILYSRQGLVFGAGYTDYHVYLLALWGLLLYIVALIAFTLSGLFSAKERAAWLIVGLILIIPISVVIQGVVPGIVQQAIVKPNELAREEPFILHNIDMTNAAYGLSNIRVESFPAENSLTPEDLRKNEDTMENIRLWDHRPLLSTYQQIQSIRTYYTFYNVDVDRYSIDGKPRQVMLAPRELERVKLPSQSWVNTRLTFTHGYGVVMNPVNSITAEGLPELLIKDIPPVSFFDVPLENTAIYYGEQLAARQSSPQNGASARSSVIDKDDYVIVKTHNKEFDYPAGDANKEVMYEGTGGIWMGSLFRRLLFAWGFRDVNILLTSSTTKESRVMFRRNIQERISHIAPFLELDSDPYIVLSEGRLFWIQDAYTLTDRYPYSEPVRCRGRQLNYIRNSVKIVVDAFHGNVDFYLMDQQEPLGKTFYNMFPTLFKKYEEMPQDLKAHVRYPKDLFKIQMLQYNTYHMKNPRVFYNKEDIWTIPTENYGGDSIPMEPYYIQMRLPNEKHLEFILMNPLTPNNKDNMIAWMAARCDGQQYGELLVYKFPKEKLVYGPSQIEARIDQNTTISQQFSLWDQRGSSVIRGNLLVIPIENSLLYVEPVYLRAEQRDLPELKRVIASYGGEVTMGINLQEALDSVFDGILRPEEQRLVEQLPTEALRDKSLSHVVRQLVDHFHAARQQLADGNWVKYGEEMKKAEEVIQLLQQQYAPQE